MIDVEYGLGNSEGSMNIYLQVVRCFYLESDAALLKLNHILKSGEDIDVLKVLIHGLKGTAANIGALNFSEESRQMELSMSDESDIIDEVQLSEYIVSYLSVLTEVKDLLEEHKIFFGEDTWCKGTKAFTKAQWSIVMKAIAAQLADYEPEAALKSLMMMKEWKIPETLVTKFSKLERALEMIQYEKAEEILNEIMKYDIE